jgi:hypothetical protein
LHVHGKAYPQGLKPLLLVVILRPKAEALGYLEAMAKAKATTTTTASAKTKYRGSSLRSE